MATTEFTKARKATKVRHRQQSVRWYSWGYRKSNIEQTSALGQKIMLHVFGNNEQTIYEVVP